MATAAPGNALSTAQPGMTAIGTPGPGSAYGGSSALGSAQAIGTNSAYRPYDYQPSAPGARAAANIPMTADRTALPAYPHTQDSGLSYPPAAAANPAGGERLRSRAAQLGLLRPERRGHGNLSEHQQLPQHQRLSQHRRLS